MLTAEWRGTEGDRRRHQGEDGPGPRRGRARARRRLAVEAWPIAVTCPFADGGPRGRTRPSLRSLTSPCRPIEHCGRACVSPSDRRGSHDPCVGDDASRHRHVGLVAVTVPSHSARVSAERPFYDLHADAYDALVTDPVEPWIDSVHQRLQSRGRVPSSILDAGCGTGTACESADRARPPGQPVGRIGAAPCHRLQRCPTSPTYLADLCEPNIRARFDAVTCRGVLNDLIEDQERDDAVRQLATLLVTDGTLFLDIREATAARRRADGRPQTRRATLDDGTILDFTWRPTWADDLLLVTERYELARPDGRRTVHEYEFCMRPWRRSEIRDTAPGTRFRHVDIRAGLGRRTPDRLFVMAQRT